VTIPWFDSDGRMTCVRFGCFAVPYVRSVYVYSVYQYPMSRVTKSKQIDLASNCGKSRRHANIEI
jgi:hypothetical protein